VLVRSAYLLGCSANDAEDVAQAALLQAYRFWDRVSGASSPDAYVHRILVNETHKHRRHSQDVLVQEPVETAEGTAAQTPDWSERIDVRRLLMDLSSDHRTVLVLRFYADLSVDEVARVLDVSSGTVKSRTSRAVQDLRNRQTPTERDGSYGRS
jgi:RNA polymerase sigma factor (sigma-70 family)